MTYLLFSLLAFLVLLSQHHAHQCAHDKQAIQLDFVETAPLPVIDNSGRVLLNWESIRIILDFTSIPYRDFLINNSYSSLDRTRFFEDLYPRDHSSSSSEFIGISIDSSEADF